MIKKLNGIDPARLLGPCPMVEERDCINKAPHLSKQVNISPFLIPKLCGNAPSWLGHIYIDHTYYVGLS